MTCPYKTCKGDGFIPALDQNGEEIFLVCQCRKDKENHVDLKEKFIGAFFPPNLTKYTYEDFEALSNKHNTPEDRKQNTINLVSLKNYIQNPERFLEEKDVLWFKGDRLSGRTSLALALGKSLLTINKKVRYIPIEQLCKMFKSFSSEGHATRLEAFEKFDIYIIDDIFDESNVGFMSKYDYQQLYSFVKLALLVGKKFIFISTIDLIKLDEISISDANLAGFKYLLYRSYKQFTIAGSFSDYLVAMNKGV